MRDAFLGGKLSEADLKAGLITAVNSLLEPVRRFATPSPPTYHAHAHVERKARMRCFKQPCACTLTRVRATISPGTQVRSHFETDKDAKRVLAQITEWMAEPKDTERKTVLKRLTVDAAAVTPQRSSNHPPAPPTRTHALQ